MKALRGAVVGALALLALASGAAWPTNVSASAAADLCKPRTSTGLMIGKVIEVVHGDVAIGGKYVGAAPFDIRSGVRICTDANGQVIFTLTRPRGRIACNTLPGSRLVATPKTLQFVAGTSWCFGQGDAGSLSGGSTTVPFEVARDTLFGVLVRPNAVIVKVVSGSVSVSGSIIRKSRQAALTSPRETDRVALTAADRSAVAELSAALAQER